MGFVSVDRNNKNNKTKKSKQPVFPTKYYLKPSSAWRDGESDLSFSSPKPARFNLAASPVFHVVTRNPTSNRKPDLIFGAKKEIQPSPRHPLDPNKIYPDWWFNNFEPDSEDTSSDTESEPELKIEEKTDIKPEIKPVHNPETDQNVPKIKEPDNKNEKKAESNKKNNKDNKKEHKTNKSLKPPKKAPKKSSPTTTSPAPLKLQNVKSRIKAQIEADKHKMKLKMQYGNYVNPADNVVIHARESKQKSVGNEAVKAASNFVKSAVADKFLEKDSQFNKNTEKQWQTPPPFVESPKFSQNHPITPIYSTPKNYDQYKWDDDDLSSLEGGPLSPEMFEDEDTRVPHLVKHASPFFMPQRVPEVPTYFNNWIGEYGAPHTRLVPKVPEPNSQLNKNKAQKSNLLWNIFKEKIEQDLPQRAPNQLQQQIEMELQLEEQQSKKRLVSSYAQTDKKPKESTNGTGILPRVRIDEPLVASISRKLSNSIKEPEILPNDIEEPAVNFSFINNTLNQTVDTLALSRGLSQIRGNTLRIARQVRQKEKEREELIEQLRTTTWLPEVDIPSSTSSSSSGSDHQTASFRSKPFSSTLLTTSTLTEPQQLTTSTLTSINTTAKTTVEQTKQENV